MVIMCIPAVTQITNSDATFSSNTDNDERSMLRITYYAPRFYYYYHHHYFYYYEKDTLSNSFCLFNMLLVSLF